jgi:competence ComEA-like helix-hairpin-helix protein
MTKEQRESAPAASALLVALILLIAAFAVVASRKEEPAVEWRDREGYSVDLNGADETTLTLLPGVGPRLAAAIVDWRRRNGPFRRPGDLRKVHGIGECKAAAILENAILESASAEEPEKEGE